MNANNTTRSSTGRPTGSPFGILPNSSIHGGNGSLGSNYFANIVLGSNNNTSSGLPVFTLPGSPRSSFASEAFKSRAAMESGLTSLKSQSVSSPLQTGADVAKIASGAVATGLTASGVGTPVALAMQASQMAGEAVKHGLNASAQNSIGRDFISNQQQWSIGGAKAAETQYSLSQQRIANANTGASIGSLFGPLGALAGWYIGKGDAFSSQAGYQVSSFGGSVSASDAQASRALNADSAGGGSNLSDTL